MQVKEYGHLYCAFQLSAASNCGHSKEKRNSENCKFNCKKKEQLPFHPLETGGGTVDTTLAECKQVGSTVVLAEAVAAEGVLAGGGYVDEEFQ